MTLAALGVLVAAATLFDFDGVPSDYRVGRGRYLDEAAAREQVTVEPDGVHVQLVAEKMSPKESFWWTSLTLPERFRSASSWLGRRVALVVLREPFIRVRKSCYLQFTDRDGECFQYRVNRIREDASNAVVRFEFDLKADGYSGKWGTSANGVIDEPLRLTALSFEYGANTGPGEYVLVRMEDDTPPPAVAPTVVSLERISTDVTFPGARPFPPARRLAFRLDRPLAGEMSLALTCNPGNLSRKGFSTNLTAVATNGLVRFTGPLPAGLSYQFQKLAFTSAAPAEKWKVIEAAGEFVQTSAEAFRFDVETGNRFHVVRSERAEERPVAVIRNPSSDVRTWRAILRFRDVFGRAFEMSFDRVVRPGETVRLPIAWPLPAKGLWFAEAEVQGEDGSVATKSSRFAWIDLHEVGPRLEKPKFRMGINFHGQRYQPNWLKPAFEALVASGAKFCRVDGGFMLGSVRPAEGTWNWTYADAFIRMTQEAGIAVDAIIQGTPEWAIDRDVLKTVNPTRHRYKMAATPGVFRDFCRALASRYGTKIDYYEIGNEWDLTPAHTLSFEQAERTLREGYEGVHAGCPTATVTTCGWATMTSRTLFDWPKPFVNEGVIEHFAGKPELYDVWALHGHGPFEAYVERLQGDFLPLREKTALAARPWSSHETGLSCWWSGEQDVARTVWAKILYAWSWGARDYIWYNLRATGWRDGEEPGYGLLTADLHPRAGYAAFAALTAIFSGLDADGRLISEHPRHLYRFKGAKPGFCGLVLAGWNWHRTERTPVRIRTDAARAELADHMGNRVPVRIAGGVVEFPLSPTPRALILHAATEADLAAADLASWVDVFTGTSGTGHTHPAAAVPFGMVQAGPDTGAGDWAHCSGYQYGDTSVLGYSLNHLSGTGCPDYGDVRILPFTGELGAEPARRAIDKGRESASPGYYRVAQPDDGLTVEVAAAKRAAIYRISGGLDGEVKVLVNLSAGLGDDRWHPVSTEAIDARTDGSDTLRADFWRSGWVSRRRIGCAIRFSRPWTRLDRLPVRGAPNDASRFVAVFPTVDQPLLVKAAFSTVDADGAVANVATSIPDWDFDAVRAAARARWNEIFARTTCEGTDDQRRNWYTALYHLYLQPNDWADADGRYRGADGAVGVSPDGTYLTTLSLWDTFRAAQPWYALAAPEVIEPVVRSLLAHYRAFGRLPVMSYGGKNVDCMIGNHAVPVIVDAYLKGFRGFDATRAFEAITNTLTVAHPGKPKENWDLYDRYGYFPCDVIKGESVSRTLECAYDDACAARFADALGQADAAAFFGRRAQNWRNVFDSTIRFARGKTTQGTWRTPFDPYAFGHGGSRDNDFTEGNAFQYTWHVMQDVPGLVAAMGGRERFVETLDALFTRRAETANATDDISGMIGQYVHGNEPSHHVIYLYPQVGQPEKAAARIREVFDTQYHVGPEGLCGNDDCGQMSAWYVFSAMGFYPFDPCGGEYVLGAPQVPRATLRLADGKTFTVVAKGLSKANKYVKSVTLNGRPVTDWKINHADIVKGGELVFEMTSRAK